MESFVGRKEETHRLVDAQAYTLKLQRPKPPNAEKKNSVVTKPIKEAELLDKNEAKMRTEAEESDHAVLSPSRRWYISKKGGEINTKRQCSSSARVEKVKVCVSVSKGTGPAARRRAAHPVRQGRVWGM